MAAPGEWKSFQEISTELDFGLIALELSSLFWHFNGLCMHVYDVQHLRLQLFEAMCVAFLTECPTWCP